MGKVAKSFDLILDTVSAGASFYIYDYLLFIIQSLLYIHLPIILFQADEHGLGSAEF